MSRRHEALARWTLNNRRSIEAYHAGHFSCLDCGRPTGHGRYYCTPCKEDR